MSGHASKIKVGERDFRFYHGPSNVGIVLVHEIFGVDEYIESVGSLLSENGVWAAVVDLYRGKYASSLEEGFKLRSSLKEKEIVDCLQAGLQLLKDRIGEGAKVGSMGFCMGGGFALLGACHLPFAFCVDYYGLIENVEQLKNVGGSIQLILGSEDTRVTPWAYQHFLPAATNYKLRTDMHLYPNAQHAFHRPGWEGHNAEAARDAWAKTLHFLSQLAKS